MVRVEKKPVQVEAWQYHQVDLVPEKMPAWMVNALNSGHIEDDLRDRSGNPYLSIHAGSHGWVRCDETDWVIKGVEDELYPCKDSVFQATYNILAD